MPFKAFGLEERSPIPNNIRRDGFKSFGTKGFPGPYYNSAIFEASQDHVLGTQAQVTLGQATCYYASTADFRDKDNAVVTFVAYDRINIVIDQMERDIVFPAVKLEFIAHSLVDMNGFNVTAAGECGGRIELTDTGTTGSKFNISGQSNGMKVKGGASVVFADNDYQSGFYQKVWGDGNYIYATNDSSILSYSVSGTGVFSFVDSNAQGGSGTYRKMHNDGNFLYVGTDNLGILSYTVASGIFTFKSSDLQVGAGRYYAVWSDGTYVYASTANLGLLTYTVDGAGAFTLVDSDLQVGAGEYRGIWGDGTYIYVGTDNLGILSYSQSGGVLTFIDSDLSPGAGIYYDVWVDNDFIYAVTNNSGLISYSSASGIFTLKDSDLQTGGGIHRDVYGNGKYVFASSQALGVLIYSKDTLGNLVFQEAKTVAGANLFNGIWADSNFIYIAETTGAAGAIGINSFSADLTNKYYLNFTGAGSLFIDGTLTP